MPNAFDNDMMTIAKGEFSETGLGNSIPVVSYTGGEFEIDGVFTEHHTTVDGGGGEVLTGNSALIVSLYEADDLYGGKAFDDESLEWQITIRDTDYFVAESHRSEGMITLILKKI